jgi:hypothetical protein
MSFSDETQRGNDTGNLNTPKDITDDISLTLTHTSEQDIHNVDNSSDISE